MFWIAAGFLLQALFAVHKICPARIRPQGLLGRALRFSAYLGAMLVLVYALYAHDPVLAIAQIILACLYYLEQKDQF